MCTVPVHTTRMNYSDNITYYVLKKRANTTKTMRFSLITKNSNWKWILLFNGADKTCSGKVFFSQLDVCMFFCFIGLCQDCVLPQEIKLAQTWSSKWQWKSTGALTRAHLCAVAHLETCGDSLEMWYSSFQMWWLT